MGTITGESITRTALLPDVLTRTVDLLSTATTLPEITGAVAHAVRTMTGADGATFVLREDDSCFYADENAVAPLWKGSRFPMSACVSGWAMLNRETAIIPDVYNDARVPVDAYQPTFVASMCMAPVRASDPIGAIGVYWADRHVPSAEEVRQIEVLANSAAVALENLELRGAISRRSAERDRMAARVDELDATMHSLAHDLRSPLGAMMGFAELIVDGSARDLGSAASYAQSILRAGERMSVQIERMLSIYRITSEPPAPDRVDVSELARAVAGSLLLQHRDRQIDIVIDDGVVVEADPVLLRLMLENLLDNAVKYTGREPVARIALRRVAVPEGVAFEVSDNGAGFDPDQADRIFRPLTRLHDQSEFAGTGLGLASVARIVQLHDGCVRADGRPGEGATFTVTLPR